MIPREQHLARVGRKISFLTGRNLQYNHSQGESHLLLLVGGEGNEQTKRQRRGERTKHKQWEKLNDMH